MRRFNPAAPAVSVVAIAPRKLCRTVSAELFKAPVKFLYMVDSSSTQCPGVGSSVVRTER
jgi:hypothetical protein